jgi:ribosome-associated toxin RatA of RatAB toxin-antitoxin module
MIRDRRTELGPMPGRRRMTTVDERLVRAPLERIFALAADVERWPEYLPHYRRVNLLERDPAGGGLVAMSANRPFAVVNWPTWWRSEMEVRPPGGVLSPAIRFRHVRGVTTGMEVEWNFAPTAGGTHVRIVHEWNGPRWPVIGGLVAMFVIGPVFIHGIASRTLAGLAHAAER